MSRTDFYLKDARTIEPADIEGLPISVFTEYITRGDITAATQSGDIIRLRSLFTYLYKHGHIEKDITKLLEVPKIKTKPIIYLSTCEVEKVFELSETHFVLAGLTEVADTKTRDDAILAVFLYTGIRISELAGLNVCDLDFDDHSFIVTRKGGNVERLYIPEVARGYLIDYLNSEPPLGRNEPLFRSTRQRKRLHPVTIRLRVKDYIKVAGIDKSITPHKLRATFATRMYESTGDIYVVANCLGHKNIETTTRYANLSERKRREAMLKLSY